MRSHLFSYNIVVYPDKITTNMLINLGQFSNEMVFSLPKQSKDLDPSYKMDLKLCDCLEAISSELSNVIAS